jgi:DNA-binding PadR family transcriptional regulator
MESISELEGAVLGIVRLLQPCTAYGVRKQLMSSPSTHWSGSAGAIYPLLSRLERAGLVASRLDGTDGRRRRLVTLSRKGQTTLRRWILQGETTEVAANVSDALRTRAFFMDALSPAERRRFVGTALDAAEAFLVAAQDYARSRDGEDEMWRLGALGGVYAAEARVRWLRELSALLSTKGS